MNLFRTIGRTMLASYFVARGVRTFLNPAQAVEEHPELAEKLSPTLTRILPDSLAEKVPADPVKLVKWCGGIQASGAIMFGTGIGRRLGAGILSATMIPHLVEQFPIGAKKFDPKSLLSPDFLTTVALTGAVILASQDTQGRPSVTWLARRQAKAVQKATAKYQKKLEKKANRKELKKKAQDFASATQDVASNVFSQVKDTAESIKEPVADVVQKVGEKLEDVISS